MEPVQQADGEDRQVGPGRIECVEPRAVPQDTQPGEAQLGTLHDGDGCHVCRGIDQVVQSHFQRQAGQKQPSDTEPDQVAPCEKGEAEHRHKGRQRPEGLRGQRCDSKDRREGRT
jgi:hypothetical protein